MLGNMTTEQPWSWPEAMDALLAAPASHRVLLENDRVRVLEVVIEPRTREPERTHRAASVMIVDEPARIRYYAGRAMQFESPEHSGAPPAVCVGWMEPEGLHSVTGSASWWFRAGRHHQCKDVLFDGRAGQVIGAGEQG
jgi:hypothetical protein